MASGRAEDLTVADRTIAVLGAGTIGASWAALFLAYGHDVAIWDPDPAAATRLADSIPRQVATVRDLRDVKVDAGAWSIAATPEAAVVGSAFVQENGPEASDAKHALYARISSALPPDAIVASSTSSLMPSALQKDVAFASRLLVGHPFNPPHLIPLVEVVPGKLTDAAIVSQAVAFYRALGKHPIELRTERPGHLANRLQAALWREAVDAVATGAASVADVDAAVTQALGPRWALLGPHATFHLAGGAGGLEHFIDHLGPAFVAQWRDLREPLLTPKLASLLVEGVSHEFPNRAPDELARDRDERLALLFRTITPIGHASANMQEQSR